MTDTHTHLTEEPLFSHLNAALARAREAGVEKFIIPGYNPESWRRAREIAKRYAGVFFAAGLHPLFINEENFPDLKIEIENKKCVAVGEIGLDYYKDDFNKNAQIEIFEKQMQLAREKNMPVIFHCRKAYDDLLAVCKNFSEIKGVLHSCSCSSEQVKPFLKLGYFVSFSGTVTRKNSRKAKKIAASVPLEKIILETDSPFIGTAEHPVPSVEPSHLPEIISAIAEIRGEPPEKIKAVAEKNAENLFKISAWS